MGLSLPTLPSPNEIRIASLCPASWEEMKGNDRVRFCKQCCKNVYNVSEMTAAEAAELVNRHEDHPCVRFHMRRNGTAITSDCQVGLRWLLWRQLRRRAGWIAAFFAWLFLPACGAGNMVRPKQPYPHRTTADPSKSEPGQPDAADQTAPRPSTPQQ